MSQPIFQTKNNNILSPGTVSSEINSQIGSRSVYSSQLATRQYKGLCLSAGGVKGILLAGALNEFWLQGQLSELQYYAGSSVGAAIALLLAVGYSPVEILTSVCATDFAAQFSTLNFMNLPSLLGLYPLSTLRNKLIELVKTKLGIIPTFIEFKEKYNKIYITPVYCLSETKVENRKTFCSPETTPDMDIVEAAVISCSIPIIFEKAVYQGKRYMDGAYTSVFPINILQNLCPPSTPILGIFLEINQNNIDSFIGLFSEMFMIPLHDQDNLSNLAPTTEVLEIAGNKANSKYKSSAFNFNLSTKEKMDMFSHGWKQIQTLLDSMKMNNKNLNEDCPEKIKYDSI